VGVNNYFLEGIEVLEIIIILLFVDVSVLVDICMTAV